MIVVMGTEKGKTHWRYQFIRDLGQGGYGRIFQAQDLLSGDTVAVKTADGPAASSLRNEFIHLHRFRHPGLPGVYDFVRSPEGAMLSLEYCPGELLAEHISRGPLPGERVWSVLGQLAAILAYIHQRGFIHGDLKPQNIILNGTAVKLLDFGLARRVGPGRTSAGTPAYASPEILSGQPNITQASDIYSLGLLAYEMLSGELPRPEARLSRNEPLVASIKQLAAGPGADMLIRMIRYDPVERLGSAGELLEQGREAGIFPGPGTTGRFDYIPQPDHLRAVLSRCKRPLPFMMAVRGEQGSGRTSLLKEINHINQLNGRPSYYFDAEAAPKNCLREMGFEPGAVLLADNADDSLDTLGKLAGEKKLGIIFTRRGGGMPQPGPAAEEFNLEQGTGRAYQRILGGYFRGANRYDLGLLVRWLLKQAGNDIGRAEKLAVHLTVKGLIRQSRGTWHFKWPEILRDDTLPREISDGLEAWWQELSREEKKLAIEISLGRARTSQDPGDNLRFKAARDRDRWMIIDDQVLRLLAGKWGKAELEDLAGSWNDRSQSNGKFFSREAYRAASARRGDWDSWAWMTALMCQRAQREKDIYGTLLWARELVDSPWIGPGQRSELAEAMTDIYCQLASWDKALETWEMLEDSREGGWEYWSRFFYIAFNGRLYDQARAKMDRITGGGERYGPRIRISAEAYRGYLAGITGDHAAGERMIRRCIELGDQTGDQGLLRTCHQLMALLFYQKSDWDQVISFWERSREYQPAPSGDYDLIRVNAAYGIALWMRKDLPRARDIYLETMGLIDPDIPNLRMAKMSYTLGLIYFDLRDWPSAERCFEACLYHALATGDQYSLISGKAGLGNVAMKQGRLSKAYQIACEVYVQAKENVRRGPPIGYLINLGILESMLGQKELALEHIARAEALNNGQEGFYSQEILLRAKAGIEMDQGQWAGAIATYQRALEATGQAPAAADPEVLSSLARAELMNGNICRARELLVQAKAAGQGNPAAACQAKSVEGLVRMAEPGTGVEGARMAIEAGKEMMESGEKYYAASTWLQAAEAAVRKNDRRALAEALPWLFRAESEFIQMGAPDKLAMAREAIINASRLYFSKAGQVSLPTDLLKGIYLLAETLSREGDQRSLAQASLKLAVEMSGAERGALFLVDGKGQISLAAQIDIDDQTRSDALEFSASAVTSTAGQGDVLISNDASIDEAFSSRLSVKRNIIRSLLCVPIRFREGAAGALYLDSRVTSGLFGQEQKEFVSALAGIIGSVLESSMLINRLRTQRADGQRPEEDIAGLIIGQSPSVQRMSDRIKAIAKAEINVLLDGESGSGKELVAQSIHKLSGRNREKFLALDCGSLPETLLESELFGYVKGSFTGASKDKTGLFESADGGTVFLDEIASASQAVQSRLLRVLENGEIRRVGESESRPVDVRVICATNKDLEIEINEGRFREDLYYRLKVVTILIPPLRERGNDILLLAEFFKDKYQKKFGKIGLRFNTEAKLQMMGYSWPGNVRELENTIQKAVLLAETKNITAKELEISADLGTAKEKRQADQKQELLDALKKFNGNITQAARSLDISRRHFYRLIEKHQIYM